MAAIDTGNPRKTSNLPSVLRRRVVDLLVPTGASLAFLFALGIVVGVIGG